MTEETKINYYRQGLKDYLFRSIVICNDIPKTLQGFIDLSIKVDNRLHQADLQLNNNTRSSSCLSNPYDSPNLTPSRSTYSQAVTQPISYNEPTADATGVVPMEIDSIKRGPLTAEEKRRRKDLNLCGYCGAASHLIKDCPLAPKRPLNRIATTSTTSAPTATSSTQAKGKGKAKPEVC